MRLLAILPTKRPLLGLFLLVLVAARAEAGQELRRRSLLLQRPAHEAPEIHVAAQTVTTLRFQRPVAPRGTRLEEGQGRFEPLVVSGGTVVITPVGTLPAMRRIPLSVVLEDGEMLSFTLMAATDAVDAQVDVFSMSESTAYFHDQFVAAQAEASRLRAELRQCRQTESSEEHLLAGLLVAGWQQKTSLRTLRTETFHGAGWKVHVQRMRSSERFVFIFVVTNLHPEKPWEFGEVRLTNDATGESWSLVSRASPFLIPPGQSGRVAAVSTLFPPKTRDRFLLELYGKGHSEFLQVRHLKLTP